jgi:hypothetical protein
MGRSRGSVLPTEPGDGLAAFGGDKPAQLSTHGEVDMNRSGRNRVLRLVRPPSLSSRLAALEREVLETRRLNQRLADLVDVITEILVPAVDRDDERMRLALASLEENAITRPGRRGRRA